MDYMIDNKMKIRSKKIGILKKKYLKALNINNCNCSNVYLNPGAEQHIKISHPKDYNNYFNSIKYIISKPDYLGLNPRVKDSIELVRVYNRDVILISIAISKKGYLYLSSMYTIGPRGNSKIKKRLKSGRLIQAP